MLIINWTPFSQTYWLPFFKCQKRKAMWYVDIRIFRLQFCLYSREMGLRILESAKRGLKK